MVDRTAQLLAAHDKRISELEANMHGLLVALASAQKTEDPAPAAMPAEEAPPAYPKLAPGRNGNDKN